MLSSQWKKILWYSQADKYTGPSYSGKSSKCRANKCEELHVYGIQKYDTTLYNISGR